MIKIFVIFDQTLFDKILKVISYAPYLIKIFKIKRRLLMYSFILPQLAIKKVVSKNACSQYVSVLCLLVTTYFQYFEYGFIQLYWPIG